MHRDGYRNYLVGLLGREIPCWKNYTFWPIGSAAVLCESQKLAINLVAPYQLERIMPHFDS